MKRILNWFRLRKLEDDLNRELQYHIDRRVTDLIHSGLPEPEARRRVALELGGATQVREEVRDIWLSRWLRDFVYDLRFSPDARHFAATVSQGGKDRLLLDGKVLASFDSIVTGTLTFSPDGLHTAAAVRDGKRYRLLIDGEMVGGFDALSQGRLAIDEKNMLHGFGVVQGKLVGVTVSLGG